MAGALASPARLRRAGLALPQPWVLVVPALVAFGVFFAYPLVDVFVRSFTEHDSGSSALANYRWFFTTGVNVTVLVRTFRTALLVTVVCLAFAYPYAYLMTTVGRRWQALMLGCVLVPFWTSLMVRNYAWIVLLQDNGVVNRLLRKLGMGQLELIGTVRGVTIGMAQILLPFMVLPLYATLRSIDRRLLLAAASLGAKPRVRFARIYLPLSLPGVLAGSLLTFVLALGFYLTPALLGSPQQSLLSQLIITQVSVLLDWGRAGAMGAVLLLATFAVIGLASLLVRRRYASGAGTHGLGVSESGALRERAAVRLLLRLWSSITAIWLVAPMLVVIPMSFTGSATFDFPPTSWSTRWYTNFFSNPDWYESLWTSIKLAVIVGVLATLLGTAAAVGLSRSSRRFAPVATALLWSPMIVPIAVLAIAVYGVFLRWHLTGTMTGFVAAYTVLATPFVLVTVSASLATFDRRLETAAASLGAGKLTTFLRVTLPLILPGVLTGAVFAFVTSFDETVIAIFLSSPTFRTLPVTMYSSVTREIDPTIAVASTLVFALTTILLLAGSRVRFVRNSLV